MLRILIATSTLLFMNPAYAGENKELKANIMAFVAVGMKCGSVEKSEKLVKLLRVLLPNDGDETSHIVETTKSVVQSYDTKYDETGKKEVCKAAGLAVDMVINQMKL